MDSFKDKVVVITGAASGIGQELGIQLAAKGAITVLSDVNEKGLKETEALIVKNGGRAYLNITNVASKEEVYALADEVMRVHGKVDVVINNAGVALGLMSIEEVSYEEMEWLLGINLWGVIYGTKAFLPHLKTRPAASIVNISSVFGLSGIPGQGTYCVSKFAVRGFTESLRAELLDQKNMHVMVVHPGGIKTNIARNARHRQIDEKEKMKFGDRFEQNAQTTSKEAARQIIRGIERKKNRIRIGKDALMMDRIYRLAPIRAVAIFAKMLRKFEDGKKVL